MAWHSTLAAILALVLPCAVLRAQQVAVSGRVVDETGAAVAGARIEVLAPDAAVPLVASSDPAGNFKLSLPAAGAYQIVAERQGFFLFRSIGQRFEASPSLLTIVLNHRQEFSERVDVTASSPAIDPQQPAERKVVDSAEISSVPYSGSQDFRNALSLIDGAVRDNNGDFHFNGAGAGQTAYSLDGFNIANPVTGWLDARINVESVQFLNVETSRVSAENGRGSAGVLELETKMGDDRLRFGGANFVPGLSSAGGFHLNHWTPRLEASGPIRKGRAWFYNGADAYYSNDTVYGLPHGQNRTSGTTFSDLARARVNLAPSNIATASVLLNLSYRSRTGLSVLSPAETTTDNRQMLLMSSLRDTQYFRGGALLDLGFADTRGFLHSLPQEGGGLYQITPAGDRGNYFVGRDRHYYRQQFIANLFVPALRLAGTHLLKFGLDFEREAFHQQTVRHDYALLGADGNVARYVTFAGNPFEQRKNFESAQYIQDHWTPREGLTIEAGVRAEWNEIVRDMEFAPRLSAAWSPWRTGQTKFSAGWGIYYDALSLQSVSQQQDQSSLATFYLPGGVAVGPLATTFQAIDRLLKAPYNRMASLSVEHRLPGGIFARAGYVRRTEVSGLAFEPLVPLPGEPFYRSVNYLLGNARSDRYDGFDIGLKRTFAKQFEWSIGYTRSRARTNAAVDYNLENPIFALQGRGPLAWDSPNRLRLWGWAPLPNRFLPPRLRFLTRNTTAAVLAEYRSGFPFNVVDQGGFLVGLPMSQRYPDYFNANLAIERSFRAMHYLWAWRCGLDNITANQNPNAVANVMGTPQFRRFYRGPGRAVDVRLRFLGRK
jgi:hypothetical protein